MDSPRHPLSSLSIDETNIARDVVISCHPDTAIGFRMISLQEPAKAELIHFLELEHSGYLSPKTRRPRRLARVHYDVVDKSKVPKYMESIVDVEAKERVSYEVISSDVHACLTV
jgi:primary-amine oxidase